MKLKGKDIEDLLHADEQEEFVPGKDQGITNITNKMQKIRNAVNERNEDTRVYGNKDKTRIKR